MAGDVREAGDGARRMITKMTTTCLTRQMEWEGHLAKGGELTVTRARSMWVMGLHLGEEDLWERIM